LRLVFSDKRTKLKVRFEKRRFVCRGFLILRGASLGMKSRFAVEVTKPFFVRIHGETASGYSAILASHFFSVVKELVR